MIDLALKNLLRNKIRSVLTILGVAVGVALLLSLASISEGINKEISDAGEELAGKIFVFPEGGSAFSSAGKLLSKDVVDELQNFEGVDYVLPYYRVFYQGNGRIDYVVGVPADMVADYVGRKIGMKEGRRIDEDDKGERVAILGQASSNYKNIEIGDTINILGKDFEVVGKLEENVHLNTIVPLDTLQKMEKTDKITGVLVRVKDIERTEEIADEIKSTLGLETQTSKDIVREFKKMTSSINIMTYAIGGIAALIGGIGIANTMLMSVSERRREIGIMKAIGATKNMILKQFLQEGIMFGLVGGIAGMCFAFLGIYILSSMVPVAITLNLILLGFLFSLGLSAVSSIYPAYRAAEVDPVVALKYE